MLIRTRILWFANPVPFVPSRGVSICRARTVDVLFIYIVGRKNIDNSDNSPGLLYPGAMHQSPQPCLGRKVSSTPLSSANYPIVHFSVVLVERKKKERGCAPCHASFGDRARILRVSTSAKKKDESASVSLSDRKTISQRSRAVQQLRP